ncbi:hypothetical protein [Streptomyces sp. NPDC002676]
MAEEGKERAERTQGTVEEAGTVAGQLHDNVSAAMPSTDAVSAAAVVGVVGFGFRVGVQA